jgi:hypothetical protein
MTVSMEQIGVHAGNGHLHGNGPHSLPLSVSNGARILAPSRNGASAHVSNITLHNTDSDNDTTQARVRSQGTVGHSGGFFCPERAICSSNVPVPTLAI